MTYMSAIIITIMINIFCIYVAVSATFERGRVLTGAAEL